MEIIEITAKDYSEIIGDNVVVYNTSAFLELNAEKVDRIIYLVGKDTKKRFAFAIGIKNGEWQAPFSAPFSSVIYLKDQVTMEQTYAFINALNDYAIQNGAKRMSIYLPANIYCDQWNAKCINALLGNGYQIEFWDVNYSFDLNNINTQNYPSTIQHMARKNLKIAINEGLAFHRCTNVEEKSIAYDVIKANREYRGFPLRMSKEQLMKTINVVPHDFFLVKKDECELASAIVYHTMRDIAQVIYWGNLPDTEHFKPINYLAYELIKYYKMSDYKILDIGISTENGIPNYGLCTFKESIGCIASM